MEESKGQTKEEIWVSLSIKVSDGNYGSYGVESGMKSDDPDVGFEDLREALLPEIEAGFKALMPIRENILKGVKVA
jgi:hypothetical protein